MQLSTSPVFGNVEGKAIDPGTLTHTFGKIVARARLSRVRFHDLRHIFASLMLMQGVHQKIVSEALGHSSVAFTLDVYSHVVPNLQQVVMHKLDAIMPPDAAPEGNVANLSREPGGLGTANGRSRTDDRRFTKPLLYH